MLSQEELNQAIKEELCRLTKQCGGWMTDQHQQALERCVGYHILTPADLHVDGVRLTRQEYYEWVKQND